MSKKSEFIEYLKNNIDFSNAPEGVNDYWTALTSSNNTKDNPEITEKGIEALKTIQTSNLNIFKSRDIADLMGAAPRSVSGTLRKLCSDGFLERLSDDTPAIYSLSEKGKTYNI